MFVVATVADVVLGKSLELIKLDEFKPAAFLKLSEVSDLLLWLTVLLFTWLLDDGAAELG